MCHSNCNTQLPYYFTTEARNTFGSDTNSTKWTLSPAGDVTHARQTTKGVFVKLTIHTHPPTHPLGCWLPFWFICMFTHTTYKHKHTHKDQNTCTHSHAHVEIGIQWHSRSAPLEKGQKFHSRLSTRLCDLEERACLCCVLWGVLRVGLSLEG